MEIDRLQEKKKSEKDDGGAAPTQKLAGVFSSQNSTKHNQNTGCAVRNVVWVSYVDNHESGTRYEQVLRPAAPGEQPDEKKGTKKNLTHCFFSPEHMADSRDSAGFKQHVHDRLLENLGEDHKVRRRKKVRPRAELGLYSPENGREGI